MSFFVDFYTDFEDINDYKDYFGDVLINTTVGPNDNTKYMWLTFALFAFLFDMVFVIIYTSSNKSIKNTMKRLSDSEAEQALQQISLSDSNDKKLILTSDYVISKDSHFAAKYSDILWAYKNITTYSGIVKLPCLVLRFADNSEIRVALKDNDTVYENVFEAFAERNPEMLIGYTQENKKAYKQLVKNH